MVHAQQPDNWDTVNAIRNGDADAFGAFVKLHYSALVDFISHYVGSPDSAKDVLQDVLLRVWDKRDNLNPEQPLVAYIYTAARNSALNYSRDRKTIQRYAEYSAAQGAGTPAAAEDPAALAEARDLERMVALAVSELPERCREIFLMSRRANMSYSEIAKALGVSVSTVKTQMGRAVEFLSKKFLILPVVAGISSFLYTTLGVWRVIRGEYGPHRSTHSRAPGQLLGGGVHYGGGGQSFRMD